MFGSFLLIICSIMHLYLFWRISSIPFIRRHLSIKHLIIIGLAAWLILFSGLFFGHDSTGFFASTLELSAMTWMAALFLTFICVFAADILTGFGFFIPQYAASIKGWALITGALLSLTGFIQGHRAPVTDNYEVYLSSLPVELDGTVIIALTDLHIGSQIGAKWLASRVVQVNDLKPDLIVLLGDVIEGRTSEKEDSFAATLARLSAPLGVYGVMGNHESYGREGAGSVSSVYDKAGIPVLRGAWKELKTGLILAGVDPPPGHMGRRDPVSGAISAALSGRPGGSVILLSHFPEGAEEAAKAGVELMLSGHTHGGQLWPFSYIVRMSYPLFAGEYKVDGMTVIVSRGAGTWGPRMRLWKPGEIARITLHAKKDNIFRRK
jgi:uncharacterized protein